MRTMHKPLLKRRTFWKGVIAGAATMAALVVAGVGAVGALAPVELSHGVRPTWEPKPSPYTYVARGDITLATCDTRGKDCTVFEDPVSPFTAPVRTVPEPSSLWLSVLAGVALVRNTLFAAATAAFVMLGRWLGMRERRTSDGLRKAYCKVVGPVCW